MRVAEPAVSVGFVSGAAVGPEGQPGLKAQRDGETREAGEDCLQKKGYCPAGAWSPAAPQTPALGSSLEPNRIQTLVFLVCV